MFLPCTLRVLACRSSAFVFLGLSSSFATVCLLAFPRRTWLLFPAFAGLSPLLDFRPWFLSHFFRSKHRSFAFLPSAFSFFRTARYVRCRVFIFGAFFLHFRGDSSAHAPPLSRFRSRVPVCVFTFSVSIFTSTFQGSLSVFFLTDFDAVFRVRLHTSPFPVLFLDFFKILKMPGLIL